MMIRIGSTLGLLLLVGACRSEASGRMEDIHVEDLPDSSGVVEGIWQTSAISDPWIDYPGEVALQIDHTLDRVPSLVLVYVAFDEGGQDSTIAAGDMARIVEVTDTTVTIRNATKQDFFVRVILQ